MMNRSVKQAVVVIGVLSVVAVARRVLGSRTHTTGTAVPSIGGDTWPPVPANPERQP